MAFDSTGHDSSLAALSQKKVTDSDYDFGRRGKRITLEKIYKLVITDGYLYITFKMRIYLP